MESVFLSTYICLILILYCSSCVLPFILGGRYQKISTSISMGLSFIGAIITIVAALVFWGLENPQPVTFSTFPAMRQDLPAIDFSFYADRLSSFFLLLTGVFTAAVVLHMSVSLEESRERHRISGVFGLFVLSIVLTILADSVFTFLIALECMTLAFSYLALHRHNAYIEHGEAAGEALEKSKTAFKIYIIFEHVGGMLIAAALLELSIQQIKGTPAGFSFDLFRKGITISQAPADLAFLLALAGFGIKAGIFPWHIWVPMVHPYSPTSIHAMMSGIALKVSGIYGMYRFFFQFLQPAHWWWGWLVLLLASATALFGVFFAILSKDLKTSLASHSVENIGIILAGIGMALIFRSEYGSNPTDNSLIQESLNGLAGLSVVASLYHLLNHSIFKGLLFFCTGAIENRTRTVEIEKLGGLLKWYPLTSTTFLIGAISIAGFPPFNGFISEWLTLQSMFAGSNFFLTRQKSLLLICLVIVIVSLAVAFALTALAFVKITGEVLLGAPQSSETLQKMKPGEVRWPMRIVLLVFAALCLLLGLFYAPVTTQLGSIATCLLPGWTLEQVTAFGNISLAVQIPGQTRPAPPEEIALPGILNNWLYDGRLPGGIIIFLFIILVASVLIGVFLHSRTAQSRKFTQFGQPWVCGLPYFPHALRYTGAAFSSLIWKPFALRKQHSSILADGAYEELSPPVPYQERLTQQIVIIDYARRAYNAFTVHLLRTSNWFGNRFQDGDIRHYLLYIFLLFIAILISLLALTGKTQP
ncbi:MAG: hypothetical protein GYA36_21075 [Veillonellaceae bacterium]|nr:hypothetical protein [Veillonellaceae bacterium]